MSRFLKRPDEPDREPSRRRSVYERFRLVAVGDPPLPEPGRPARLEVQMGHVVEVRPCCSNPLECHRPECWRTIIDGRPWDERF